jgi:soluble lytic murein transglycosylase
MAILHAFVSYRASRVLGSRRFSALLGGLLAVLAAVLAQVAPLAIAPPIGARIQAGLPVLTGPPAAQAQETPATLLARADQRMTEGGYDVAAALYVSALQAEAPDPVDVAMRAASAYLAAGRWQEATDLASGAVRQDPTASDAYIIYAQAAAQLGNTDEAVDALNTSVALNPAGGYAAFRAAEIRAQQGNAAAAEHLYDQAVALGLTPEWATVAERRAAQLALTAGDPARAVAWLERASRSAALVEAANGPVWFDGALVRNAMEARQPAVLLELASAYRAAGREDARASTLVGIVHDYPQSSEGQTALSRLEASGDADLLDAYSRGLALYRASRFAAAQALLDNFAAANPADAAAPTALYYSALAERDGGERAAAAVDLVAMAAQYPASRLAPEALSIAARIHEADDGPVASIPSYVAIATAYPNTDAAGRALLHVAAISYNAGDAPRAMVVWRDLGDSSVSAQIRAQALYQYGRTAAELGDVRGGRPALQQAAQLAPLTFEGLRAADLVEGGPGADPYRGRLTSQLAGQDRAQDDAACGTWLDDWTNPGDAASAMPTLALADRLLLVGMPDAAVAETMAAIRTASSPRALYALGAGLRDRGLYAESIAAGQRLLAMAQGGSSGAAPDCVQRLIYPLAYADLVQRAAAREGLDPYVVLALFRQESWFSPWARSSADARGLAQILPATARDVARALGDAAPSTADLYRPEIGIRLGAWYLGDLQRTFGGRPLIATAGYNAGGGNATRWARVADPDDFVERIDFTETSGYVRSVYEQYMRYRALYG